MGATPSKEEPAAKRDVLRADVDQGFFSSLWLCGGGDAVDDKAIEKVRKHNDRSGDIRTARVNDAARVTESADLFVREFKQTMRERGFAGFKYNRNGRSAPRIFLLDTNEQMARRGAGRATRRPARRRRAPPQVQWKTKKTAKVVNGDKSAPGAVTRPRAGGGGARGHRRRCGRARAAGSTRSSSSTSRTCRAAARRARAGSSRATRPSASSTRARREPGSRGRPPDAASSAGSTRVPADVWTARALPSGPRRSAAVVRRTGPAIRARDIDVDTWPAQVLTIHCAARRLVVGFETEQRCQMFADGLALIVAEAKERLKPKARAAPAPASADDLDAASRVVRA